jgi:hypothetical protein
MTGSQKKLLRQRFKKHIYPVKTFQGDPTRPAYTLYSLWDYSTYLAASNELDELVDQWPQNQPRTIALLAVRAAFFENGATHWVEQLVWSENQVNIHALMLNERQRARRHAPTLEVRHTKNLVLAQAVLAESQRRKQGPPTGSLRPSVQKRKPKCLYSLRKYLPRKKKSLLPTPNAQLNILF